MRSDSTGSGLRGGCGAAAPTIRVYLAGELCVEAGERLLTERSLPGPQARHLLALLVAEHRRAVGRDEIADELWDGSPPAAWATSLKALASRLRRALTAAGLDGTHLITGAPGVYRFRLPDSGWVDIDAAQAATHKAESLLSAGDCDDALREAFVARLITARPMLPGRSGSWLEHCRSRLADLRIRALECSARAHIANGAPAKAVGDAGRAVEVAPLREPTWRLLMDAHAAAGDLGSALAAFARCQKTLREALGVGPSADTRRRHESLLAQAG